MRKFFLVVVIASLALAGCGDDDEETTTTGGPATTMGDMPGMNMGQEGDQPDPGTVDCDVQDQTVKIVAENTKFNTDCLAAPGQREVLVEFENRDTINHSFVVLRSHMSNDVIARAEVFTGPRTVRLTVPGQPAGSYAFHCEVHPQVMKGTFVFK